LRNDTAKDPQINCDVKRDIVLSQDTTRGPHINCDFKSDIDLRNDTTKDLQIDCDIKRGILLWKDATRLTRGLHNNCGFEEACTTTAVSKPQLLCRPLVSLVAV